MAVKVPDVIPPWEDRKRKRWERPHWWVQGKKQGSDKKWRWFGLYCYRTEQEARRAFLSLMSVDSLPRDLQEYDDFRVVPPRLKEKRRAGAPDDPEQAAQAAQDAPEPDGTTQTYPAPRSGPKRAHSAPKKKVKK